MAQEKLYRIGEVAAMLDLNTSVLRFWESEFPELTPVRTAKGHRCYKESDVELLRRIRQLLHEQGMTIEGARKVLDGASGSKHSPQEEAEALRCTERIAFYDRLLLELENVRRVLAMEEKK